MKTLLRMASVAVCMLLMAPAIADAKARWVPTRVALGPPDTNFVRGHLHSGVKGCARERAVRLIDPGTGSILHVTTTRNGRFTVRLADLPPGTDAIEVRATTQRIGNWICMRDTADLAIDFATIDGAPSNGAFRGVLFSNIAVCEPGRLVTLYEVSSDPVAVGSALTDANGAWTIAQAGGFYQVRAEPKLIGAGDTFTYCPEAVSDPWFYEEPPEEEEP